MSTSDGASFLIIKAAADDADDIDDLPDDETTTGQKLDYTSDDLSGINAMNTAKTAKNEQGKQQCGKSGTGRLRHAVLDTFQLMKVQFYSFSLTINTDAWYKPAADLSLGNRKKEGHMEKQSHKRLKVLLGCYACDPNRGSEPGMGWNFAYSISKHHDVHALVEEGEFRESLERFSKENPEAVRNITFHFIPRSHHNLLRKIWPPSYYWFYRSWHKRALRLAKELDKQEHFDIVHQVNMAGYREPGYLWKLGKPFIWGPLGGFTNTEWCLLFGLGFRDFIYFALRNVINSYQKRHSEAAKRVSKAAHTIIVSDPDGVHVVRNLWNRETLLMREVGTYDSPQNSRISQHAPGTPLRICWAGALITLKALPILLRALPLCTHSIQVEVLGGGAKETEWKQLTKDLQLEHCVRYHGFIPHSEVAAVMSSCHLMCITSIHEGGTTSVCLEALQNGLPIVALDHCGFASVVDDTCGIKIPIRSQAKISAQLAKALDKLAEDEELRLQLAHGAIERSKAFTWDAKMQVLNQVYAEAVAANNPN